MITSCWFPDGTQFSPFVQLLAFMVPVQNQIFTQGSPAKEMVPLAVIWKDAAVCCHAPGLNFALHIFYLVSDSRTISSP